MSYETVSRIERQWGGQLPPSEMMALLYIAHVTRFNASQDEPLHWYGPGQLSRLARLYRGKPQQRKRAACQALDSLVSKGVLKRGPGRAGCPVDFYINITGPTQDDAIDSRAKEGIS